MAFLLALALVALQDLAGFLDSLEKDRAKGVSSEELLKKLDAWAAGKPEEMVARLAWNRGLFEATIRMDALFVEGLKKRIGKPVTLGKSSGVIKDVKPDRVVLTVAGGTIELMFNSISFDVRLEDIKKQELLPARSAEEAIFRFAAGKSVAAMGTARAIPPGADQDRALAAIAGWVLQQTDRAIAAGPYLKAVEEFAASWAKEADLVAAGGGAIRKFIDTDLAPKLVEQADAILEKDRKEARKMLDLAASLCKADEIAQKVAERRWSVLDKGEWMSIPLEAVMHSGGELKGKAIAYEDTAEEKDKVTGLRITSLPVSWEEISGIKARVKPGKTDHIDMRFVWDKPPEAHNVAVQIKDGLGGHWHFVQGKEPKMGAGSTRKVAKKTEYEFVAQWEGKKWKFSVAGTEIDSFQVDGGDPKELGFIASDGNAELLSLQVRKK